MGIETSRGGIITNLDNPVIDPATRIQIEKDERAQAIVDQAVAEAKKAGHGGDTFKAGTLDEYEDGRINVDVTRGEVKKTDRDLGQSVWVGQPALVVQSASEFQWRFGDPRKVEMIEEGRFCPNCLQQQATVGGPKCEWAFAKSSQIPGCGYSFIADETFGWDR